MKVTEKSESATVEGGGSDPVGRAVAGFATVDRAMGEILRAIAQAGPVEGVPAVRLISLAAGATGWDLRYLGRTVQTLSAMPKVWAAFDAGQLSWSQLRGITTAAKGLRVADRHTLDRLLAKMIDTETAGEPDRIVEVAADLAGRLDDAATQQREAAQDKTGFLRFQPDLFGGVDVNGHLDDVAAATVTEALDAAADPPVADDDPPAVDADGKPVPAAWRRPTSRSSQLAEALRRICLSWLDGDGSGGGDTADGTTERQRGARPAAMVIVDLTDLRGPNQYGGTTDGVPVATARLLWRLAGGRRRLSQARVQALSCDASHIPLLTDGNIPLAIGDAHDPIPTAVRRAAAVRDQGCRFPGCHAPQQWTDLHHVVFREHHGRTELANLVSLCRFCHTLVHTHGWQLTLDDDATLTVRRGRWRFVSHPRLRPPTTPHDDNSGDAGGEHGLDPPGDPPAAINLCPDGRAVDDDLADATLPF